MVLSARSQIWVLPDRTRREIQTQDRFRMPIRFLGV